MKLIVNVAVSVVLLLSTTGCFTPAHLERLNPHARIRDAYVIPGRGADRVVARYRSKIGAWYQIDVSAEELVFGKSSPLTAGRGEFVTLRQSALNQANANLTDCSGLPAGPFRGEFAEGEDVWEAGEE